MVFNLVGQKSPIKTLQSKWLPDVRHPAAILIEQKP